MFTRNSTVEQVINDLAFDGFGRLLFPIHRSISNTMTLEDISSSQVYIWYSHIMFQDTIDIINDLKTRVKYNQQIFYPIYSKDEQSKDHLKKDTGLFFFRGEKNAPFSIHCAGGGFMYVAAMHDSFPHALHLSKQGYNAFVLIYRPDYAYEDLAQAIHYIYRHSIELEVDKNNYSLWGGSAGARMAASLGNKKVMQYYHLHDIPPAKAVIMQYTSYTAVSLDDAPTYACVGTKDGIAYYKTMENRLKQLNQLNIPTEFHVYKGLGHGFGLGKNTVAEGWIHDAIQFWKEQMDV